MTDMESEGNHSVIVVTKGYSGISKKPRPDLE